MKVGELLIWVIGILLLLTAVFIESFVAKIILSVVGVLVLGFMLGGVITAYKPKNK